MEFADVAQLGIGGITLFLLTQVWNELKAVNQFNRDMLRELMEDRRLAEEQRVTLMEDQGIDPNESGI